MSDWQPISTAPKDRYVLLFRPAVRSGKGRVGIGRWASDEYAKKPKPFWGSVEAWINKTEDRAYPPTHWMPLPQPPEDAR